MTKKDIKNVKQHVEITTSHTSKIRNLEHDKEVLKKKVKKLEQEGQVLKSTLEQAARETQELKVNLSSSLRFIKNQILLLTRESLPASEPNSRRDSHDEEMLLQLTRHLSRERLSKSGGSSHVDKKKESSEASAHHGHLRRSGSKKHKPRRRESDTCHGNYLRMQYGSAPDRSFRLPRESSNSERSGSRDDRSFERSFERSSERSETERPHSDRRSPGSAERSLGRTRGSSRGRSRDRSRERLHDERSHDERSRDERSCDERSRGGDGSHEGLHNLLRRRRSSGRIQHKNTGPSFTTRRGAPSKPQTILKPFTRSAPPSTINSAHNSLATSPIRDEREKSEFEIHRTHLEEDSGEDFPEDLQDPEDHQVPTGPPGPTAGCYDNEPVKDFFAEADEGTEENSPSPKSRTLFGAAKKYFLGTKEEKGEKGEKGEKEEKEEKEETDPADVVQTTWQHQPSPVPYYNDLPHHLRKNFFELPNDV